jgi:hypothetical protein
MISGYQNRAFQLVSTQSENSGSLPPDQPENEPQLKREDTVAAQNPLPEPPGYPAEFRLLQGGSFPTEFQPDNPLNSAFHFQFFNPLSNLLPSYPIPALLCTYPGISQPAIPYEANTPSEFMPKPGSVYYLPNFYLTHPNTQPFPHDLRPRDVFGAAHASSFKKEPIATTNGYENEYSKIPAHLNSEINNKRKEQPAILDNHSNKIKRKTSTSNLDDTNFNSCAHDKSNPRNLKFNTNIKNYPSFPPEILSSNANAFFTRPVKKEILNTSFNAHKEIIQKKENLNAIKADPYAEDHKDFSREISVNAIQPAEVIRQPTLALPLRNVLDGALKRNILKTDISELILFSPKNESEIHQYALAVQLYLLVLGTFNRESLACRQIVESIYGKMDKLIEHAEAEYGKPNYKMARKFAETMVSLIFPEQTTRAYADLMKKYQPAETRLAGRINEKYMRDHCKEFRSIEEILDPYVIKENGNLFSLRKNF